MESKTVLALGWSPSLSERSELPKPVESPIPSLKSKPQIPLPPRTLWTRCLEAVVEFSRVVFDLFYGIHYLSVVCADHVENKKKTLITWELGDQRLSKLQAALASYECPFSDPQQAFAGHQTIASVSSFTESLKLIFQSTQAETSAKSFASHILLISAVSSECQLTEMQKHISTCLCSNPSTHLDITLLNVLFDFCSNRPLTLPKYSIAPNCSFCCISCPGTELSDQVMTLCRSFYSLSTVIIKGIPMKEEQSKPAPSHYYDVELYHSQEAQRDFLRTSGYTTPPGVKLNQGGELVFDFKWCTPKKSNLDFRHCSGSWRISPVLVSHRPTACLFTFLHQGNQVLLEHHRAQVTPSDSPTPTPISFTLLTHNKAAFLHSIPHIPRTPIDDPPSGPISPTGRGHESRVEDFARLTERYQLEPLPVDTHSLGFMSPCDQALRKLLWQNHHLPSIQSDSLLHQLSDRFKPILSTQELPALTEDAITACKDLLSELDAMMRKGEPLIQSRTIPKGKREDSYFQLWKELIYLLDGSQHICEGAKHVYTHLYSLLQNLPHELMKSVLLQTFEDAKSETMKHLNRLSHAPQVDSRVRRVLPYQDSTGVKRKLDGSPIQPSFSPSRVNIQPTHQQISLLAMWSINVEKDAQSRHVEFAGRVNSTSNRAELYGLRTRDPMQGEHSLNL